MASTSFLITILKIPYLERQYDTWYNAHVQNSFKLRDPYQPQPTSLKNANLSENGVDYRMHRRTEEETLN